MATAQATTIKKGSKFTHKTGATFEVISIKAGKTKKVEITVSDVIYRRAFFEQDKVVELWCFDEDAPVVHIPGTAANDGAWIMKDSKKCYFSYFVAKLFDFEEMVRNGEFTAQL